MSAPFRRSTKLSRDLRRAQLAVYCAPIVERPCECNDCDRPECCLPAGRCYLCGTPCDKANTISDDRIEFTVGPCCYAIVQRVYNHTSEHRETWGMFNGNGYDVCELQRDDEADFFESDADVAAHVARCLGVKPTYPEGF